MARCIHLNNSLTCPQCAAHSNHQWSKAYQAEKSRIQQREAREAARRERNRERAQELASDGLRLAAHASKKARQTLSDDRGKPVDRVGLTKLKWILVAVAVLVLTLPVGALPIVGKFFAAVGTLAALAIVGYVVVLFKSVEGK